MSRILSIDLGNKRTGIAVTDPMRIIATPLETSPTYKLIDFLRSYFSIEEVDEIILGYPTQLNNSDTDMTKMSGQ